MEIYTDLHVHTTASDGNDNINTIIKKSFQEKVTTLSITDHNTIDAYKEIDYKLLRKTNTLLIPGIELTAKRTNKVHILGYGININDNNLATFVQNIKLKRDSYFTVLIESLKANHKDVFTDSFFSSIDLKNNFNKVLIARECVKRGYSKDVNEAFNNYLNTSLNDIRFMNPYCNEEETISVIKKAGGVAVLAHPFTLKLDNYLLEEYLLELVNKGLEGIEAYHSSHKKYDTNFYLSLANKHKLLVSGGSDYHGVLSRPDVLLGRVKLKEDKLTVLKKVKKSCIK